MTPSRLAEANKLIAEGEKYLKTGLFKWKADYDSAAPCFQKAGISYKNAKEFQRACELFLKTADCHFKNGSRFHAAKAYEEAGMVCKELKKFDKFAAHFDHASNLYMEDGTPDTAALCLIRAGKTLESIEPSWALELYTKAVGVYVNETDGRVRSAAEVTGRVSRLLVKMNKYEEALKSIDKEKEYYAQFDGGDHGASGRLVSCQVLIYLLLGDQVRADSVIADGTERIAGFAGSDEYNILRELMAAFDARDQDKTTMLLKSPMFKYMDAVYARLTRSIKVAGYSNGNSKMSPTTPNGEDEDDDDDDDLC